MSVWSIYQTHAAEEEGDCAAKHDYNYYYLRSKSRWTFCVFFPCLWSCSVANLFLGCYIRMGLYLSGPELVISSWVRLWTALWACRAKYSYHYLITLLLFLLSAVKILKQCVYFLLFFERLVDFCHVWCKTFYHNIDSGDTRTLCWCQYNVLWVC